MGGFSQGAQERSTYDLGFELEALNEPSVLKETLCLVKSFEHSFEHWSPPSACVGGGPEGKWNSEMFLSCTTGYP